MCVYISVYNLHVHVKCIRTAAITAATSIHIHMYIYMVFLCINVLQKHATTKLNIEVRLAGVVGLHGWCGWRRNVDG